MLSAIQAKPCSLISNLNLFFPEVAVTELFLLNSYPAVTLTSSIILSFGLKAINNLASLLFDYGACKIGDDCAKQTFSVSSVETIASQSLNLPIFFISPADNWTHKLIKTIGKIIKIFLIMDMG